MPEQGHQRLQRATGVDQRRGVGMAQLVREDVSDAGGGGGTVQFGTQRVLRQPPTVVGEQELGGSAGAWVADRPSG